MRAGPRQAMVGDGKTHRLVSKPNLKEPLLGVPAGLSAALGMTLYKLGVQATPKSEPPGKRFMIQNVLNWMRAQKEPRRAPGLASAGIGSYRVWTQEPLAFDHSYW